MNKILLNAVLTIILSLVSASANADYTFTNLGSLFRDGLSINNSGQIAGNLINSPNNYSTAIYNNGAWNSLGALNLILAQAHTQFEINCELPLSINHSARWSSTLNSLGASTPSVLYAHTQFATSC
jgi:hypothetical protein